MPQFSSLWPYETLDPIDDFELKCGDSHRKVNVQPNRIVSDLLNPCPHFQVIVDAGALIGIREEDIFSDRLFCGKTRDDSMQWWSRTFCYRMMEALLTARNSKVSETSPQESEEAIADFVTNGERVARVLRAIQTGALHDTTELKMVLDFLVGSHERFRQVVIYQLINDADVRDIEEAIRQMAAFCGVDADYRLGQKTDREWAADINSGKFRPTCANYPG